MKRGQISATELIIGVVILLVIAAIILTTFKGGFNAVVARFSSSQVQAYIDVCEEHCELGSSLEYCAEPKTFLSKADTRFDEVTALTSEQQNALPVSKLKGWYKIVDESKVKGEIGKYYDDSFKILNEDASYSSTSNELTEAAYDKIKLPLTLFNYSESGIDAIKLGELNTAIKAFLLKMDKVKAVDHAYNLFIQYKYGNYNGGKVQLTCKELSEHPAWKTHFQTCDNPEILSRCQTATTD